MIKVDKRTIQANYMNKLQHDFENINPTQYDVLEKYLKRLDYSDDVIEDIIEKEKFKNLVEAAMYADLLGYLEEVMKEYASLVYMEMGDIVKKLEAKLASDFGVKKEEVDVYNSVHQALARLEKMNKVDVQVNTANQHRNVYKYIG